MTVIELPSRGSALDRVVAAAKLMEEHDEVDRWTFADDVQEAVDDLSGAQNGFELVAPGQRHAGFFRAIDTVNTEIIKAGVVNVGRQSIVGAYTTAKAWPEDERVEGANYWAHFELRARAYDGKRQQILKRLVRQHKQTVSTPQVRLWKSNLKPVDLTPRDERLERKLRSVLRAWASPQTFVQLADSEQDMAVLLLRRLATEIAAGEFS